MWVLPTEDASARVVKAPVFYLGTQGTADVSPFFQLGGLRLTGACAPAADPVPSIQVASGAANAMVHVNAQGPMALAYTEDDDLDTGASFSLFPSLGIAGNFIGGQLMYSRPNGRHVTITWGRTQALEFGQPERCAFYGIARVARGGKDPRTRKRVDFRAEPGAATRALAAGGLTLRARCTGAGRMGVVARTAIDHAVLHANVQGASANAFAGDTNLRNGERFNLFRRLGGGRDDSAGQIVYVNPKGTVVSIDWLAEEADAYGGGRQCAFVGTARVAKKRSRERAYFARKRSKPFLVPRAGARGVPAPDYQRFLRRSPFELLGACARPPDGNPGLYGLAGVDAAGAGMAAEQAAAGDEVRGGSTASGSTFSLLQAPTRSAGHAAFMTTSGALFTTSWLAQQRVAFGKPARRKLCLLAGTTERIAAP
jgi:hypothetical protein